MSTMVDRGKTGDDLEVNVAGALERPIADRL
jgi:hypothetical protein